VKVSVREFANKFDALVKNGSQNWKKVDISMDPNGSYYITGMQEYGLIQPASLQTRVVKHHPRRLALGLSNGGVWNLPLVVTYRNIDDWRTLTMAQRLNLEPIIGPSENGKFVLICRTDKKRTRYCTESDISRRAAGKDSPKARLSYVPQANGEDIKDIEQGSDIFKNEDMEFVLNQEWKKFTYDFAPSHWFGFVVLAFVLGCCIHGQERCPSFLYRLENQEGDQLENQEGDQLENQEGDQLENQVGDQLENQRIANLKEQLDEIYVGLDGNVGTDHSVITVYSKKEEEKFAHLFHLGCLNNFFDSFDSQGQRCTYINPINRQPIIKFEYGNPNSLDHDDCSICLEPLNHSNTDENEVDDVDIEMVDMKHSGWLSSNLADLRNSD